jgi:hypothetical protein
MLNCTYHVILMGMLNCMLHAMLLVWDCWILCLMPYHSYRYTELHIWCCVMGVLTHTFGVVILLEGRNCIFGATLLWGCWTACLIPCRFYKGVNYVFDPMLVLWIITQHWRSCGYCFEQGGFIACLTGRLSCAAQNTLLVLLCYLSPCDGFMYFR